MTKPKTSRLVEERQLESLLVFKIVHQPPNGVLDMERMVDEIPNCLLLCFFAARLLGEKMGDIGRYRADIDMKARYLRWHLRCEQFLLASDKYSTVWGGGALL